MFLLILTLCATVSALPLSQLEAHNCGYESCHKVKEGFINVHIVPHTHDDVGWLKTVDQYYYGSRTNIQKAGVQYILDSVVEALRKDNNRRFIYVETAFFWKWWIKQHDFVKSHVRRFIKNGQLEFIGGAWSMNDEAVTHYQSIIDQFTWGLRKLNDTFGHCGRPKIGWQIDPFGHSREMASIFAQLGFDGLLLGRIDYQDKQFRFSSKTPEMVWRASESLGPKSEIFTSVMYNTYSPPPGFCFDVLCSDEPIIDDKKSSDYNVPKRLSNFFKYLDAQSKAYTTNNLIVTMGGDFTYMDANFWFKNLDKLIRYANEEQKNGSKYHLIYSTPSCYLKAVHDEAIAKNQKWNTKQDDFFPYASDPNAYWTGYFTSRPTIKRFERVGNNFLQVCKQLYALTDLGPEDWTDLNHLREAMGVMQHHDAVTGTEKEHVARDYSKLLSKGMDECGFVAATALSKIISGKKVNDEPKPEIPFDTCHLLNVSQCEFTEKQKEFVVTVYNPLSRNINKYIRIPVSGNAYSVKGPEGDLKVQLVPIHKAVQNIPGRKSDANLELIFYAAELPPLGFKSYYVKEISGNMVTKPSKLKKLRNAMNSVQVDIDDKSGLIVGLNMNGKNISINQNFFYYRGSVGDNENFTKRSSGAYIFRPNGTTAYTISENAKVLHFLGEHVDEIHQTFNNWTSQTIRVYKSENYVEFDWTVGPIPISDDFNGKEIITKYSTALDSESTFYTDSNGREMLKRVRTFRPTWKLDLHEPIAGNYYPVTSKILIRDPHNDVEVAVLTDRAQGGSSINDGEIELMVHRRCLHDDAFGVGEALNEEAFGAGLVVRGSHYLVAGPYINKDGLAVDERNLAQSKILDAWTFISPTNNLSYEEYKSKYKMEFAGIKKSLPKNVQILTLEPWKGMDFLIRLEHILEKEEDPSLSVPVTINLKDLFVPFKIKTYKETTLGANQWLKDNKRLDFPTDENLEDLVDYFDSYNPTKDSVEKQWKLGKKKWNWSQLETNNIRHSFRKNRPLPEIRDEEFNVTLTPMQIRTFIIEIEEN